MENTNKRGERLEEFSQRAEGINWKQENIWYIEKLITKRQSASKKTEYAKQKLQSRA